MLSRYLAPLSPSRNLRPADPFTELHQEMNRLFDDFLGGSGTQGGAMMAPRLDVKENEQEICVLAELPGVDPSQVDVRLDGSVLTIRGEKKSESEQDKQDYHVMERSFGRFQRSLQLPYDPQADQVRADFRNGLLTVHLPKQPQQERSRRIDVHVAEGQQQGQPAHVASGASPGEGGTNDPRVTH